MPPCSCHCLTLNPNPQSAPLCLQESGLARVLLQDLGLETVMRIDRPASPGDKLSVRCKFVDVPTGR